MSLHGDVMEDLTPIGKYTVGVPLIIVVYAAGLAIFVGMTILMPVFAIVESSKVKEAWWKFWGIFFK